MNRDQLAHVLRAACRLTGVEDVLVLGSQSILGSFDEDDLPPAATASMEVDVAFFDDEDRHIADKVDGAIGELSHFHSTFGIYAEGVTIETATFLPSGWRSRLVQWNLQSSAPARPHFLDPHDLAVAKLGARREKDLAFVAALIETGLLDLDILLSRVAELPAEQIDVRVGLEQHLRSYRRTDP